MCCIQGSCFEIIVRTTWFKEYEYIVITSILFYLSSLCSVSTAWISHRLTIFSARPSYDCLDCHLGKLANGAQVCKGTIVISGNTFIIYIIVRFSPLHLYSRCKKFVSRHASSLRFMRRRATWEETKPQTFAGRLFKLICAKPKYNMTPYRGHHAVPSVCLAKEWVALSIAVSGRIVFTINYKKCCLI